jgi:hypothetical protein
MNVLPTTFEKVSNVKRYNTWIDGPTTTFRLKPPGRQEREAIIRSNPSLRDGMRVIAVLRDKDDWSTLVGWKDLETQSIVAKSHEVAVRALALRFSLLAAILFASLMGVYFPLLLYPIILCLFGLWQGLQEWRDSRETRQRLAIIGVTSEA